MSRTFTVYLVDWSLFREAASRKIAIVLFDPAFEAVQDVPDCMLLQIRSLIFKPKSPVFENLQAAVDCGTKYDRLRGYLAPESRRRWDRLLQALFWWGEEGGCSPQCDHTCEGIDSHEFLLSLNPESVAALAEQFAQLSPDDLGAPYKRAASDPRFAPDFSGTCRLPDETAFLNYLDDWRRLLTDAMKSEKGIVLQ